MKRKRARDRHTLRVNADARPIDVLRDTARQFTPDATDEEIVQGLRDLADALERDAAMRERAGVI